MQMDASSAINTLQETRAHAAAVAAKAVDLIHRLQAVQHKEAEDLKVAETLQHSFQTHLDEERARAKEATDAALALIASTRSTFERAGPLIKADTSAVITDLDTALHASEAGATVLAQTTDHLAQLAAKAQHAHESATQTTHEHLEVEHSEAHQQFEAGLNTLQQSVTAESTRSAHEIDVVYQNDFQAQREQAHAHVEQTAEHGVQTLHDRAERLHTDVGHDVDALHQHHDQHHQELETRVARLKDEMTQLGAAITGTAHGMADGVDVASLALQQTNLGVTEVMKIISEIEDLFKDIIGSFP